MTPYCTYTFCMESLLHCTKPSFSAEGYWAASMHGVVLSGALIQYVCIYIYRYIFFLSVKTSTCLCLEDKFAHTRASAVRVQSERPQLAGQRQIFLILLKQAGNKAAASPLSSHCKLQHIAWPASAGAPSCCLFPPAGSACLCRPALPFPHMFRLTCFTHFCCIRESHLLKCCQVFAIYCLCRIGILLGLFEHDRRCWLPLLSVYTCTCQTSRQRDLGLS